MTLSMAERRAFFQEHSPAARKVMFSSGFLASITLAQMGLEGGYGKSSLARVYFNHFGIKGKGDAGSVLLPTKEEVGGVMITVNANFRAYTSLEAGLADRTKMLYNAKRGTEFRYRHLFGVKDYITVARGLKRGGYATDSLYAEKLISIIQEFDLDQYDKGEVIELPNEKPPIVVPTPPRSTPSSWAKDSVEWAKENQVFDGLRLDQNCTREELAVIMYRFNTYASRQTGERLSSLSLMLTDVMNVVEELQSRISELELVVENLDKTTQALTPRKSLLSFLNPKSWGVKQ